MKRDILNIIECASLQGLSQQKICDVLQIHARRVQRWKRRRQKTDSLKYYKSGPIKATHAIIPDEIESILEYVEQDHTCDMSLQQLSHTAREEGIFTVSASVIRTVLHNNGLMTPRRERRHNVNKNVPPLRPDDLNGPNQCWCWDISYIHTDIKRVYYYLFVMLDEWSRKVVAWNISYSMNENDAKQLIDAAILNENILNVEEGKRPVVINDRGKQMKAKIVKKMFSDMKMPQTYARPRTPNDNAYIESFFGTVKTNVKWPGWFPANNSDTVYDYFKKYFYWYNYKHFHSGIHYMHPIDKHNQKEDEIIKKRKDNLTQQRNKRKIFWKNNDNDNTL
jgi:putative transposase